MARVVAAAVALVAASRLELRLALQGVVDFQSKLGGGVAIQATYQDAEGPITVAAGKSGNQSASTQDTFLFGSATKTFTATAIMRAHKEGKLDLNATVSTYVDPLFMKGANQTFVEMYGPNATNMTVWHLVSMQSGIPDFDVPTFDTLMLTTAKNHSWTPLEILQYGATQPWICLPGDCVYYSSTNFVMLGMVLLSLQSGDPADWVKLDQHILTPHSAPEYLDQDPANKYLTIPGYSHDGNGTVIFDQPSGMHGWTCGNMVANTRDVAQYMYALLVERSILDEETLRLMTDTRPISIGWGTGMLEYGAGLFIQQVQPKKRTTPVLGEWGTTLGHGGDTFGFVSDQGWIPQLNASWSYAGASDTPYWSFSLTCNMISALAKVILGNSTIDCSFKEILV